MRNIITVITDMIFTRRCPGCGEPVDIFADSDICPSCLPGFRDISDKMFYVSDIRCLKAVYSFSGPARHGLHRFKFRGDGSAGIFFADRIAEMIRNEKYFDKNCVLVPIPGNIEKTDREYVQAVFLAKRRARKLHIGYVGDAMRKKKSVISQTKCRTLLARRENIANAFILNKRSASKLCGKKVIIIDDISTTGSTISSAARTLKKANPAEIYAACAARTPTHKDIGKKYIVRCPDNMKTLLVVAKGNSDS